MAYENLCMYCFQDLNGESICPHCGKEYKSKDSLAKHIKDKHPEGEHPEAGQS